MKWGDLLGNQNLHPTVVDFKNFINNHPKLLKEIRKSGRSWQEYYEKWILLGEDDPYWEVFKHDTEKKEEKKSGEKEGNVKEKSTELMNQMMKYAENIDVNKVQGHVHQLSNAIGSVQELLEQFQTSKQPEQPVRRDPFDWRRD